MKKVKIPKKSAPAAGHGTPSPPRMDTLWGPRAGPERRAQVRILLPRGGCRWTPALGSWLCERKRQKFANDTMHLLRTSA